VSDSPYAAPIVVDSAGDCYFYHKIDVPGFGTLGGDWDLRHCVDAYLGHYDFAGQRVLDVGAASGYLTFEMERRGAEVVSFDLDDGANWDIVPHFLLRAELPSIRAAHSATVQRVKNAYWLTHRAVGSPARAAYGDIYDMDARLGEFDIIFYGMIVGHLRDPYQALYQGARRCRRTMLVVSIFEDAPSPRATLIPRRDRSDNLAIKSWWSMTTGLIDQMLGTLGFAAKDIVESEPLITAAGWGTRTCQTIVAERI
jgi:SAM-dependent methyltransferase